MLISIIDQNLIEKWIFDNKNSKIQGRFRLTNTNFILVDSCVISKHNVVLTIIL